MHGYGLRHFGLRYPSGFDHFASLKLINDKRLAGDPANEFGKAACIAWDRGNLFSLRQCVSFAGVQ